jgi:hypothetical protein
MRQVQTKVYQSAMFGEEEWNSVATGRAGKDFNLNAWSTRSITVPLDLQRGYGATAIPEGGYEAMPSSPAPIDATLTFINVNKRISFSRIAEILRQRSPQAFIEAENDLKWQGKKAVQALRRKFALMFYGFSTGTVGKVSSVSTDDLVVKDMYGISGLGATTHNLRCVDFFEVGDRIAVLNPSGPAFRGIFTVASKARSTNTLTGTAVSDAGAQVDDLLVFAGNLENTTLAGGTERNLNLVGLLDMMTSTSVHSVSGDTYALWNPSFTQTTSGRFTPVTFKKMQYGISSQGPDGSKLTDVWFAPGVHNDLFDQQQAGVRFEGGKDFEIDGDPKATGTTFHKSRLTPDGYVFGYDRNNSLKKGMLFPDPGEQPFDEGSIDKLQDISGKVASLDFPIFLFTTSRAGMAYVSGATQL